MSNLEQYRASEDEKARTADLLRMLPRGRRSVLEIGARDGHFSRLLANYFTEVVALDLEKPSFEIDRVITVEGDVTRLNFADDSFDCVFCTEVLEHVPDLQKACHEISRVARHEVIVGVPFKQDIRVGRLSCQRCGKTNPPWGHVNSFDENRLRGLFSGLQVVSRTFVGKTKESTNPLSTFLMDIARNPWGTYEQDEPCIHCGAKLTRPQSRPLWQKGCSFLAARINGLQSLWTKPHENWIHLVFSKRATHKSERVAVGAVRARWS
jgi:SAM-dependent methyltransferase